jgi:hypothetical protein
MWLYEILGNYFIAVVSVKRDKQRILRDKELGFCIIGPRLII